MGWFSALKSRFSHKKQTRHIKREPVLESEPTSEDVAAVLDESKRIAAPTQNHGVVSLVLRAVPGKPYSGYELLQALLAAGLRYGEMNIFHRHEFDHGRGSLLFSLASAVAPGTFELTKMGAFSSPALTLFLQISRAKHPSQAFETMLETARQLTSDLGGDVLDSERLVLNDERVLLIRERIANAEQRAGTADLFA